MEIENRFQFQEDSANPMIVCLCRGISDREIKLLIRGGARSLEDLRSSCGAGSGCGSCHSQLRTLLAGDAEQPSESAPAAAPARRLRLVGNG
jgi:bacterioferritin-associated ferredoxin